jgi:hypothetical protein
MVCDRILIDMMQLTLRMAMYPARTGLRSVGRFDWARKVHNASAPRSHMRQARLQVQAATPRQRTSLPAPKHQTRTTTTPTATSTMTASIDSETLKQYLADSPPAVVPLAIKPHFDALSDKEKLYAHHLSVYGNRGTPIYEEVLLNT